MPAHGPSLSANKDAMLSGGRGNEGAMMLITFPPQAALGLANPLALARWEFYSLGE